MKKMSNNFRVFEIDDDEPDFSFIEDDSISLFSEELEETLGEEGWLAHPYVEEVTGKAETKEEEIKPEEVPAFSDLYGLRHEYPENEKNELSEEFAEEIHPENVAEPVEVPVEMPIEECAGPALEEMQPEEVLQVIDMVEIPGTEEVTENATSTVETLSERHIIQGVADDEFYQHFGDIKLSVKSVPMEDLQEVFYNNASDEQRIPEQLEPQQTPEKSSMGRSILSWALTVVIAFIIAMLINVFVFRPSEVSGESMKPTLQNGDTVILSRLPYLFDQPDRGDIVVIDSRVPEEGEDKRSVFALFSEALKYNVITKMCGVKEPDYFWIKRVIGVAGDKISFEANCVYRNGEELHESYINEQDTFTYPNGVSVEVPEGYVYVMGDNRNHSSDSRVIGLVPVENIIGKMVSHW